jgi:hypothetical protein
MPNITLSIDEELLRSSREYAKTHDDTLNGLVRKLLTQAVLNGDAQWIEECLALMDRAQARSGGRTWRREDLYDV